mgnify:CR=1 FL=1
MGVFEGGLFAALTMAFGIAPGRRWMPQTVALKVVPNVRIEPVLDLSDVMSDQSDICPDVSPGPVGPSAASADLSVRPPDPPTRAASTRAFVKWWRGLSDVPAEISMRYLLGLYAEYCELENVAPLSERQLQCKLKTNGVESYRGETKIVNGKMHRPTVYRLKSRGRS